MTWETRKGKQYYYRGRRTKDGKVVKEYLGAGADAGFAADQDALARAEQQTETRRRKKDQLRIETSTAPLDQFAEGVDTLIHATLLNGGYYDCHGKWRRRCNERRTD